MAAFIITLFSTTVTGQAFTTPSALQICEINSRRYISNLRRHRPARTPTLSSQLGNYDDEQAEDEPSISNSAFYRAVSTLDKILGDDSDDTSYTSEKNRIHMIEREIQLLSQLDPDHPINKIDSKHEEEIYEHLTKMEEKTLESLWSIWYGQRGALNEQKLRFYESRLVDIHGSSIWPGVLEHYRRFLDLIYENCLIDKSDMIKGNKRLEDVEFDKLDLGKWIEPPHILAYLLAKTGRLAESKEWTEEVLAEKPWHIGALSIMRIVCLRLNDEEAAMRWAVKALPGLSPQTRLWRTKWVRENVDLAKEKLAELKEDLRDKIVARMEDSVQTTSSAMPEDMFGVDDSAWQ